MRNNLDKAVDLFAQNVSFREGRNARNELCYRELPEVGMYILFNEVIKSHDKSGSPYRGRRGIALVKEYVGNNIYIDVYATPLYTRRECFQKNDIRLGLLEYVILKDKIYTGIGSGYTREDLDINNPHPDIFSLYYDNYKITEKKYSHG